MIHVYRASPQEAEFKFASDKITAVLLEHVQGNHFLQLGPIFPFLKHQTIEYVIEPCDKNVVNPEDQSYDSAFTIRTLNRRYYDSDTDFIREERPAKYQLKNKQRNSWINVINPFRGFIVAGTPGAGKSYSFIRHVITQHIQKGFSMFTYDFKFPDLSLIVYNTWLQNKQRYKIVPEFYVINFDDLTRSNRCNPLDPSGMVDITDAAESARTILMGLNREWIKKQGDSFVESPINFLSAIIWFLRKHENGAFCTLPHVIELMQSNYDSLFMILRTEKEIDVLINPLVNAYLNDVMEQSKGQIASAKISMARLSSPQLYYVLSGTDFTLDINNPDEPKLVCVATIRRKYRSMARCSRCM